MILPIVAFGSPVLRQKCVDISADYSDLEILLENMRETMYKARGVGLAAPQINKNIRLFLIDTTPFVDDEEDLMGIRCVGCPIFDHRNFPVYSLWTTGPSFRLSHEKIVEYGNYLKELCQNISKDLGATNGA